MIIQEDCHKKRKRKKAPQEKPVTSQWVMVVLFRRVNESKDYIINPRIRGGKCPKEPPWVSMEWMMEMLKK